MSASIMYVQLAPGISAYSPRSRTVHEGELLICVKVLDEIIHRPFHQAASWSATARALISTIEEALTRQMQRRLSPPPNTPCTGAAYGPRVP